MSKPVILCIDDDPTVLESLKRELTQCLGDTCFVATAGSSRAALDLLTHLQTHDRRVALVLVGDLSLEMKSDQLLSAIQDRSPQTLKILLSNQADLQLIGKVMRSTRLYACLPKPWQPEELRATVLEGVERYGQERQLQQAEAALARSQTQLSEVLNSAIAAIVRLRVYPDRRWKYEFVSAGCELVFGYTAAELTALPEPSHLLLLTTDRDRIMAATEAIFAAILTEQTGTIEHQIRHKDSSLRWVSTNFVSQRAANEDAWFVTAVATDISDRKRAEAALAHQVNRQRALNRVVQTIRKSLDLSTCFTTAVQEIGHLLQVDRADVVRYLPQRNLWLNLADYRRFPDMPSALGLEIPDEGNEVAAQLKRSQLVRIDNATTCNDPVNQEFAQVFPGAWLLVPLEVDRDSGPQVWGSFSLVREDVITPWQDWEVELVREVADQLAIAIQQSELYQQVQQLNRDLETQVQERTAQLEQALEFEALLKRIIEKVRDSLDETQILETVVQELAEGLGMSCCDTGLYDLEAGTSTIAYEYITFPVKPLLGEVITMANHPEVFNPLQRGEWLQFCWRVPEDDLRTIPSSSALPVSVLACPLVDAQQVMGDLWLFKAGAASFSEAELRLVQQVANQCAIALRQSRLYQTTQAQVRELERLNSLKDDFLGSVSHELRSPMSNIKMAMQMVQLSLQRLDLLQAEADPLSRYFQILKEECDRETRLINDLLDLARLEAETEPFSPTPIEIATWLPQVIEPFIERIRNQQQQLILHIPPDLPLLITEPPYLERAIAELLHNACKYTPLGETIKVSVTALPTEMHVQISNSGVEIPATEYSRIFEKFYRIPNNDRRRQGGTGLGLALVQRQIQRLQGTIDITCEASWTQFTIRLPFEP